VEAAGAAIAAGAPRARFMIEEMREQSGGMLSCKSAY